MVSYCSDHRKKSSRRKPIYQKQLQIHLPQKAITEKEQKKKKEEGQTLLGKVLLQPSFYRQEAHNLVGTLSYNISRRIVETYGQSDTATTLDTRRLRTAQLH